MSEEISSGAIAGNPPPTSLRRLLRPRGLLAAATIAGIVVAIPLVPAVLSQFYVGLVTLGLIYGLFAFGLDVAWGRAGIVSIGHAVFFGIGAYGLAILQTRGHSALLGAALGIGAAVALSAALGWSALRRRATASTMAMLTLALTLLGAQVATAWTSLTGGTDGLLVLTSLTVDQVYWLTVAVCIAVLLACELLVFRTATGNRIVAMRLNPQRAQQLGIDVRRLGIACLALGAGIAAIAGVIAPLQISGVTPELAGIILSTQVLIWVAIGGRDTLLGPFFGAMLYTLGRNLLGNVSVNYYMLTLGILFVVVVLVAPDGIVGRLRRPRQVRAVRRSWNRGSRTVQRAAGEVLQVAGAVKRFGAYAAVDGVSLSVSAGEIVCLVGPNGAGKTTLLNLISGELERDGGRIVLIGRDVTRAPVHARVAAGLARTFQVPSLFTELTVREHLTLARQEAPAAPELPGIFERFDGPLAELRPGELSLGDRRALEIAIALAAAPQLLLLDEPAAGLAREDAYELARMLLRIRERLGCAMVAVEHDMEIVRMLADRVIVLHRGAILSDGSWEQVHRDEQVRAAYLGAA